MYVDLTHELCETSPIYPGKSCFTRFIQAHYENGYCAENIAMSAGVGTHMDAPTHFYEHLTSIDKIPLERCIAPGYILHLSGNGPDYAIAADDILKFEKQYGPIPPKAIVLANTGWAKHWGSKTFVGEDEKGVCHFPGFSKEAAQLLAKRDVGGVGIDTLSLDVGNAKRFEVHEVLLEKGIFLIENLAQLDKLPPIGTTIFALPIKMKDSPEAPARVFAQLRNEHD